jgi:hypothetical protein
MPKSTFLPANSDLALTLFIDDEIAFVGVQKIYAWELVHDEIGGGKIITTPIPVMLSDDKPVYLIDKEFNLIDPLDGEVHISANESLKEAIELAVYKIALTSGHAGRDTFNKVECEAMDIYYEIGAEPA